MFKAIGNFFSAVFGTPSKTTDNVVNVPDKLEPPIVKLGPEKDESVGSIKTVADMKVESKPKKSRAKKVESDATTSSVKKPVEKKDKPAKAPTEKKSRTKKQQ